MGTEICYECGRSVSEGSELFVNRIPIADDYETRKANGYHFPEGKFMCRECDAWFQRDENSRKDDMIGLCPRCGGCLDYHADRYDDDLLFKDYTCCDCGLESYEVYKAQFIGHETFRSKEDTEAIDRFYNKKKEAI